MGYYDYEYELAAEEISNFMRGRTYAFCDETPSGVNRCRLPTAIYAGSVWNLFRGRTVRHSLVLDEHVYREKLVRDGVVIPHRGPGKLHMDGKAREEALREIRDWCEHGAYADRGITISRGRPE